MRRGMAGAGPVAQELALQVAAVAAHVGVHERAPGPQRRSGGDEEMVEGADCLKRGLRRRLVACVQNDQVERGQVRRNRQPFPALR